MKVLLNAKANPDRLSKYGLTPTQVSLSMGDKEIISMMLTAYRPNSRDRARQRKLEEKPFNGKENALREMIDYAEHFYAEHDRMWGPDTGYESLI